MKSRVTLSLLLVGGVIAAVCWWHNTTRSASPADILARSDPGGTRFEYAWIGGFGFGHTDVRASFSGDGFATLQVGLQAPAQVPLSKVRYRSLIATLASNRFDEINVRRRWGVYVYDMGRFEFLLTDGPRKTLVFVDEKHYVPEPTLLNPILDQIYSFEEEFGRRLNYGPLGMAAVKDTREVALLFGIAGACIVIGVWLGWRIRRRRNSKDDLAPSGNRATRPDCSNL